MTIGVLVLICIFAGCVAALFVGLLARRNWYFGVLAGIVASSGANQILGLSTWGSKYFWEEQARLAALTLGPVVIVSWLGARRGRKLLGENV